jgi:hypothetical protein
MTKRVVQSVRLLASVVALCLVLLQLVNALHFALVPHGFGAGLRSFVHQHRALVAPREDALNSAATQQTPDRPTLVAGVAASAPEACPVGFSGPPSTPVPPSQLCSLIWLPSVREHVSRNLVVGDRSRSLLSAPKTSPPRSV